MHILQIEHPIRDFDTWKEAFDRFSDKRRQDGRRGPEVPKDPGLLGFPTPRCATPTTTPSSTVWRAHTLRWRLLLLRRGGGCG